MQKYITDWDSNRLVPEDARGHGMSGREDLGCPVA